ncbi:MAG: hypothetical protein O6945_13705 [Gammaproteobacteria bacterium]|nr:hypothetical protein [Gammaproteobacteria bacterium]
MPRTTHNHSLNTAGLEADVMRFMAIIAFCLISIMALVKKIEPAAVGNELEANIASPVVQVEAIRVPEVAFRASTDLPVIEISPQLEESATAGNEAAVVKKSSERIVIPNTAKSEILPLRRAPPRVVSRDREPLTFRFDSDRTFLHLIATNNLLLYASTADGFLGMDSGFNVVQSEPAGELYEVIPKSIPRKITNIFERNAAAPVYLVALPATTKQDLNKFLDSGNSQSTGTLVIHRDGHISHEI